MIYLIQIKITHLRFVL